MSVFLITCTVKWLFILMLSLTGNLSITKVRFL